MAVAGKTASATRLFRDSEVYRKGRLSTTAFMPWSPVPVGLSSKTGSYCPPAPGPAAPIAPKLEVAPGGRVPAVRLALAAGACELTGCAAGGVSPQAASIRNSPPVTASKRERGMRLFDIRFGPSGVSYLPGTLLPAFKI